MARTIDVESRIEEELELVDLRGMEAEGAAEKLHEAMNAEAEEYGQDADLETALYTPEEDAAHGFFGTGVRRVVWEAAPYHDWGVREHFGEIPSSCFAGR